MREKSGKQPRKLPERGDALKIDLEFEDAIKAALETPSPKTAPRKRRKRKPKDD